jgi:hypothetical protein
MTAKPADAPKPAPELSRQFYDQVLSEAERADLPLALEINGVDQEIALLRLRLRSALLERPDDLALIFKGIDLLAKAVAARYQLSKHSEEELAAAMAKVAASVGGLWPEDLIDA